MYINKQPPIVINRKALSFVVQAGAPVIIKPAPVVIQKPGQSEYRPYVQTVTSAPIIVDKKIIKIERPIVKKYYQEAYSQTLPSEGSQSIPIQPVLPSPCDNLANLAPSVAPVLSSDIPLSASLPSAIPLAAPISIQPVGSVPVDIQALLAGVPSINQAAAPCGCSTY